MDWVHEILRWFGRRFLQMKTCGNQARDRIFRWFGRANQARQKIFRWLGRRFPQMKPFYWWVVAFLFVAWLIFAIACGSTKLRVQAFAAAATAGAAVIALGLGDPPRGEIFIKQEGGVYLQTERGQPEPGHRVTYEKNDLHKEHRGHFERYPETFHSFRVGFNLVNASGFALKRPRMTITVPAGCMHPSDPSGKSWKPTCHAWFGLPVDVAWPPSPVEDKVGIQARFADDWGRGDTMRFWVRLVLDNKHVPKPIHLDITIRCENAESTALEVPIPPDLVSSQAAAQG